jgi:hypothetical protein
MLMNIIVMPHGLGSGLPRFEAMSLSAFARDAGETYNAPNTLF